MSLVVSGLALLHADLYDTLSIDTGTQSKVFVKIVSKCPIPIKQKILNDSQDVRRINKKDDVDQRQNYDPSVAKIDFDYDADKEEERVKVKEREE